MTNEGYKRKFKADPETGKVFEKTKYSPELCRKLIEHFSKGFSFKAFGGAPGMFVTIDDLYGWVKKYPEFAEAKKIGETKREMFFEEEIRRVGRTPGLSSSAMIFLAKNLTDLRDVSELRGGGKTGEFTFRWLKDNEG